MIDEDGPRSRANSEPREPTATTQLLRRRTASNADGRSSRSGLPWLRRLQRAPDPAAPLPQSDSSSDEDGFGGDQRYAFYDSADEGPEINLPNTPRRPVESLMQEFQETRKRLKRRQQTSVQQGDGNDESLPPAAGGWLQQQHQGLVRRSRKMADKLRGGRARAWRHKWVFSLMQADGLLSMYWLGASPQTWHWYYTAKITVMLTIRCVEFSLKRWNYFLLDFCYFSNVLVLLFIWAFPDSPSFFSAAEGFSGLLLISLVIFRNSCVLHDWARMANGCLHYLAPVAIWCARNCANPDRFPAVQKSFDSSLTSRIFSAWVGYLTWAVCYYFVIFVVAKERILRKQRQTLYIYVAHDLGLLKQLPYTLRNWSELVFMVGHQSLFLLGLPWLVLPPAAQAGLIICLMLIFFHNGGRFYVDHFWKAHETNTVLYLDAAVSTMQSAEKG